MSVAQCTPCIGAHLRDPSNVLVDIIHGVPTFRGRSSRRAVSFVDPRISL